MCLTFKFSRLSRPRSRPLTHNETAAWGRRGVRYSSCGVQTFIFALHFLRSYTPACAKPHVICCHLWSVFVVSLSEDVFVSEKCSFLTEFSGCINLSSRLNFLQRCRGVIASRIALSKFQIAFHCSVALFGFSLVMPFQSTFVKSV